MGVVDHLGLWIASSDKKLRIAEFLSEYARLKVQEKDFTKKNPLGFF